MAKPVKRGVIEIHDGGNAVYYVHSHEPLGILERIGGSWYFNCGEGAGFLNEFILRDVYDEIRERNAKI